MSKIYLHRYAITFPLRERPLGVRASSTSWRNRSCPSMTTKRNYWARPYTVQAATNPKPLECSESAVIACATRWRNTICGKGKQIKGGTSAQDPTSWPRISFVQGGSLLWFQDYST